MIKNDFTAALPAVRCTPEMRERVLTVAGAAGCDMADVIRDALEVNLVHMELQLGLNKMDDYDDVQLETAGLRRAERVDPSFTLDADNFEPPTEDRTRGLAWGPPAVPTKQ